MRVLVVEDHVTLADRIAQGLRQAGMAVDAVHDGAAAVEAAGQTTYDVIVLDRDLPVMHGDRVCRAVAGSGPRILMLTAATSVDDRVDGLELGADDYLGKPFAFAELVARVRALSRRAPSVPPVLHRGDLTVDLARHRASRGARSLSLTRKEFGMLEMLLAADGAVVSAEDLLEHVWDAHADPFSNIVSVTMTRLRRKLGDPPLIETVVGKGYRMRGPLERVGEPVHGGLLRTHLGLGRIVLLPGQVLLLLLQVGRGGGRGATAAGREDVLAGTSGRLVLGITDPELLRGGLSGLRAAGWLGVGVVRHPVGAHALGEG